MKKSNVKSLCVAMAAAMTVGSMTPAFSADAASKAKFDKTYKKVRQDVGTYNYNLKGLKKNYKVKWTIEDGNKNVITDGVSLENQGKKVTSTGTSLSNKLTIEDISSLDAGLKAKTKYYVVARVYVKNTKTKKYEFSYKVRDRIYFFADAEDVTLSVKENTISNDTVETKVGSMLDFDSAQKPKNATTTVYYSAKNASGQAIELKKGVTGTALTYAGSGKITFNEAGEFDITVETKRSKTSKVTATKTVKVIVKEDKTEEPTPEVTEGAKQTGIQTITLTTKENINVASAASIISVKKGSSTVNLDSTNPFIVDGNTVYIKTASRMTAGDYTVTVNGKKYTFKAEDERVDKIEILNDKLVVKKEGNSNNVYKSGTVGYHVLNQFAEDMTRRSQVTANSTAFNINSSTGTVTYTQNTEIRIGDKIALTLINTTTGKSDSKILTVSAEANVAEIEVADIQGNKTYVYNKDKKALTEDTDLDVDKFYILFTAKDQYENVLNPSDKNGRDTVSKGILFSIPGLTNLGIKSETNKDSNTEVTQMEVNGKNYFAVQLTKKDPDKSLTAGTDNTLMICKGSGKNVTTPITVNAGSKVATISVSAPDVVIAGQPATFEFTALDANGNDVSNKLAGYYTNVTKKSDGSDIYTGAQNTKKTGDKSNNAMTTIPDNFVFEKNYDTNKVELKYYSDDSETDRPQYVTFVTATNQVVSVQFTVKASSKPTTITKIAADKLTAVNVKGQKLEIKQENITIEDQYGKVMPQDEIKKDKNKTNYKYVLNVEGTNDIFDIATGQSMNLKEGGGEKVFTATVKSSNDGKDPNPGEVRMSIKLQKKVSTGNGWEDISGSEYSFTMKTVDYKKAFKSYTVDDIGKLFDKDRYSSSDKVSTSNEKILKRELGVYGVMSDGTKVRLPGELYNAQNSLTTYENNGNGFIKVSSKPNYADKNDDYKTSISIVIGHSGETITKELVISKAAPTVNKLEARDGSITKWSIDNTDKVKGKTEVSSTDLAEAILQKFKAFIQYNGEDDVAVASGQAYAIDKDGLGISKPASITISDKSENCKFKIEGNGTNNLIITEDLNKGDEFTVTVKAGTATAKSKFVVQRDVKVVKGTTTPDTPKDDTIGETSATVKTKNGLAEALEKAKQLENSDSSKTYTITVEEGIETEVVDGKETLNIGTGEHKNVKLIVKAPITYVNEALFSKVIIENQDNNTWFEKVGNNITLATGGTIKFNQNALATKKELTIKQISKNPAPVSIEKVDNNAVAEIKNFIVNIVNALKPVTVKVPSQLKVETAEDIIDIKADTELTLKENAKANIKVSGSEDGEKINLTVASNSALSKDAPITVTGRNTTVTLETAAAVTVTKGAVATIDFKTPDAASNSIIKVVTGTTIRAESPDIKEALNNKITVTDKNGITITGGSINVEVKGDNGKYEGETVPVKPQSPVITSANVKEIVFNTSNGAITVSQGATISNDNYNAISKSTTGTAIITGVEDTETDEVKTTVTSGKVEYELSNGNKGTITFTVTPDGGNTGDGSGDKDDTTINVESLTFTKDNVNISVVSNSVISSTTFEAIKDLHTAKINGATETAVTVSAIDIDNNTSGASIKFASNDGEITGTMPVKIFRVDTIKIVSGSSTNASNISETSITITGNNEMINVSASSLGANATTESVIATTGNIKFEAYGSDVKKDIAAIWDTTNKEVTLTVSSNTNINVTEKYTIKFVDDTKNG